jgi:uncharacterized membrane protein YhfC
MYNPCGGFMDILQLAYIITPILIFLMAIGLGFYLARKYKLGWRLFFIGGATYLGAQIAALLIMSLIPNLYQSENPRLLVELLLDVLFVLILFTIEEGIRYAMYRWWAKDVRTWTEGLLVGAGHGGVEIIFLGLVAITTIVQLIQLRNADLVNMVSAENLAAVTKSVADYWSKPWPYPLAEAVRCALTLPIQLSCSLLVLQVFLRQQIRWLGYSIGWHFLATSPLFFASYLINVEKYIYFPLIFVAIAAVGSVVLILRLQTQKEQAM